MRLIHRLAALAVLLCASFGPAAAAETWTVASEDNFPPYNFSQDGKRTGMDTEIVEAVLTRLGITPDHKAMPWNRVVNDLDHDQVDLAFQFVGKPERFEKYHMIGPHRSGLTVFAVRADSALTFDTLDDLKGQRIGVVNGFSYTPEFDQADFLKKEAVSDNAQNLRKLAAGRLDAIIGDLHTLSYLAKGEKLDGKLKFLPKALSEVPRYIAFPKPRGDKADRFAKALADLQADGTIAGIVKRWQ